MIIGKTRTNQPVESDNDYAIKPQSEEVIDIHIESEQTTGEITLTDEQVALLSKYSLFNVYYYNNDTDYRYNAIVGKNGYYGVAVLDDTNSYDFTATININTELSKVFLSNGGNDYFLRIEPLL